MLILLIAILLVCFFGFRCAIARPQTLEFENVFQYKLDLNPGTKVPEKISGLCGRSMYCVQGLTSKTNGTTLVILVKIGFCKEGQSGGFSYPLKISDNIKELRFGTKEYQLWKRQQ